ncbi:unnamed protein product [Dibothriocephalus latus]|uniref:Uncharacterized protein n=1 Tax=Dibothriocephalus latus TaxID=60516 RepID=A0A3P7N7U0_DIBLA|nr:unnamed protein product [Dibothriocephalus latus]
MNRLSLRKRRIVRSPYTPTRKRAAPRLHSTPTLASVLERPVDSPAVSISPPLPVSTVPSFRPLGGDLGCTSPIVGRSTLVVGQRATEADKKASNEDCTTTAVTDVCPPAKRPLATKDQLFDLNPPMCPPSSNPLGKLNGAF